MLEAESDILTMQPQALVRSSGSMPNTNPLEVPVNRMRGGIAMPLSSELLREEVSKTATNTELFDENDPFTYKVLRRSFSFRTKGKRKNGLTWWRSYPIQ